MSEFSTDENNYTIKTLDCYYNNTIIQVYLDNKLIMIAGSEKEIAYHLRYVICKNELNISYGNVLSNNKLVNNLIDQCIGEVMYNDTPDTNIMLSERTATLM